MITVDSALDRLSMAAYGADVTEVVLVYHGGLADPASWRIKKQLPDSAYRSLAHTARRIDISAAQGCSSKATPSRGLQAQWLECLPLPCSCADNGGGCSSRTQIPIAAAWTWRAGRLHGPSARLVTGEMKFWWPQIDEDNRTTRDSNPNRDPSTSGQHPFRHGARLALESRGAVRVAVPGSAHAWDCEQLVGVLLSALLKDSWLRRGALDSPWLGFGISTELDLATTLSSL
jgi:hypothetical protein